MALLNKQNIRKEPLSEELENHFFKMSVLFPLGQENLQLFFYSMICFKRLIDNNYFPKKIREEFEHLSLVSIGDFYSKFEMVYNLLVEYSSSKLSFPKTIFEDANNFEINSLYGLINHLNNIDLSGEKFDESTFGRVFDEIINGHISSTPAIIRRIMVELLGLKTKCTIYDPAVGTGGIFIEIKNQTRAKNISLNHFRFFGQENNSFIYSLLKLNMLMNGIDNQDILFSDVFYNPLKIGNQLRTYDFIVSDIPWNISNKKYKDIFSFDTFSRFSFGIPKDSNYAFIQHIISSLNKNGKAVILCPPNILWKKGSDKKIRENIVKEDLIEAIIQLPPNILETTSLQPVILILDKNKPKELKNKIFFSTLDNINVIDEEARGVLSLYKNFQQKKGLSKIINLSEIISNNSDLSVVRYLSTYRNLSEMNKTKVKKLKDLVWQQSEIFTGAFIAEKDYPFVRNKDLKSDINFMYLDKKELSSRKFNRKDRAKGITRKCLLITTLGNNLKPMIFYPDHEREESKKGKKIYVLGYDKILFSKDIIALLPKGDVDIEYLYYQMYSTEVQEQIKLFRHGTIPHISINDLLNIFIPYVPLKEQKEKIEENKSSLLELETLRHQERIKEFDVKKSAFEAEETMMSILSHNILPYTTNMGMAFDQLVRYLKNKNLLEDYLFNDSNKIYNLDLIDDEVGDLEKVKDVTDRIKNYLSTFQDIIVKTRETVMLSLKEEDFVNSNLKDIFEEIISFKNREANGKYKIVYSCPDNVIVPLNKPTFKEAVMNLIRNAQDHAFENNDIKNIIRFDVDNDDDDDLIIITYQNNGKRFNLTEEEFFSLGRKSKSSKGFGLGGYYIRKVIELHEGNILIMPSNIGLKLWILLPKERGVPAAGGRGR